MNIWHEVPNFVKIGYSTWRPKYVLLLPAIQALAPSEVLSGCYDSQSGMLYYVAALFFFFF